MKDKAVVLLSGGMDSSTLLYYAKTQHDEIHALSFDYGQRHKKELNAAKAIAKLLNVPIKILQLPVEIFKRGGPLVDTTIDVPKQEEDKQALTVVPFRNSFFLLFAAAYARQIDAKYVYIGACGDDQRSYPDCRPHFFEAFQQMINAQDEDIIIKYPFVYKSKKEIVQLGTELGVPWELTWTCYRGEEEACGECDACVERLLAFKEANLNDPLPYRKKPW